MPCKFHVAPVLPETCFGASVALNTAEELLNEQANRIANPEEWDYDDTPPDTMVMMQSSFTTMNFPRRNIHSQRNGFVQTVTKAYNDHHHLIIRPDDVWIAILSQLSIYVNKNAEKLRHLFVPHDGQKKLVITMHKNRNKSDFGDLANQMTHKIQENILDPDLRKWILPDFTTTTPDDTVICSVMMMATMKSYFEYEMSKCGIPSVTLEGEKCDWVNLQGRIEKLASFGEEPSKWVRLLRPICDRFVSAFDGDHDVNFWNKVSVNYSLGSGTRFLSGWITAFCVWDSEGRWQGNPRTEPIVRFGQTHFHPRREIENVLYPSIDTQNIPMGFCQVDVKVIDDFGSSNCVMISGHMATSVEGYQHDTVRPLPCWFMFSNTECESGRHTGHDPCLNQRSPSKAPISCAYEAQKKKKSHLALEIFRVDVKHLREQAESLPHHSPSFCTPCLLETIMQILWLHQYKKKKKKEKDITGNTKGRFDDLFPDRVSCHLLTCVL